MTPSDPASPSPEQQALQRALARLMASVAHLAVARGLPFAAAEELLKQAFVDAASAAHPDQLEHRKVSRISTATGINRREVTRLRRPGNAAREAGAPAGRTAASELFTHWRTSTPYSGSKGQPLRLPRQGPPPSFESLAQEVTRDVHPRSLLDELCRLGVARWDEATDTVALQRDAYVPRGDSVRMLGFLGDNVGDHLQAAVQNVLAPQSQHFEQALFADGLSAESVAALRPLVSDQWRALRAAVVPALEGFIAADTAGAARVRVRVGLYAFHEMPPEPAEPAGKDVAASRRGGKRAGGTSLTTPAQAETVAAAAAAAPKRRRKREP